MEIGQLICSANHWTGFYVITAPIMKELNLQAKIAIIIKIEH